MRMGEERGMRRQCPYASNPYHLCGKYCSQKPLRAKVPTIDENLAPNGVGGEENGEELGGRRNVDPYSQFGDYCIRSNPDEKSSPKGAKSAPNVVGGERNGEEEGGRKHVDHLCVYASNPYHQCADYCTRRNPNERSSPKGAKSAWWSNMKEARKGASFVLPFMASEGRKERVMIVNTNNVNSSCPYASNPYHQCAKYCSQRTNEMIKIKQGKPERCSRGVEVTHRENVDPRCKYALNPYHNCTSYCSLKINQVA